MVVTTVLRLKSEAAVKMKKEAIIIDAHTINTQMCRQGEFPVKIYLSIYYEDLYLTFLNFRYFCNLNFVWKGPSSDLTSNHAEMYVHKTQKVFLSNEIVFASWSPSLQKLLCQCFWPNWAALWSEEREDWPRAEETWQTNGTEQSLRARSNKSTKRWGKLSFCKLDIGV